MAILYLYVIVYLLGLYVTTPGNSRKDSLSKPLGQITATENSCISQRQRLDQQYVMTVGLDAKELRDQSAFENPVNRECC